MCDICRVIDDASKFHGILSKQHEIVDDESLDFIRALPHASNTSSDALVERQKVCFPKFSKKDILNSSNFVIATLIAIFFVKVSREMTNIADLINLPQEVRDRGIILVEHLHEYMKLQGYSNSAIISSCLFISTKYGIFNNFIHVNLFSSQFHVRYPGNIEGSPSLLRFCDVNEIENVKTCIFQLSNVLQTSTTILTIEGFISWLGFRSKLKIKKKSK